MTSGSQRPKPDLSEREKRRNAARQRALVRLAQAHAEDFRAIYEEELTAALIDGCDHHFELTEDGYRCVHCDTLVDGTDLSVVDVRCPWKRAQVKASHGDITRYGRSCIHEVGHDGPHEVPRRAKQSNDGVWFNPDTGVSITQHDADATSNP